MVIFEKDGLRISLITPNLLRTETGVFCDAPTQTVQNRDFGKVEYEIKEQQERVTVTTSAFEFIVDKKSGKVMNIVKGNLPGTARTLDMANGAVKLEDGIVGRNGVSVMDDSRSLIINSDGTISPRPKCTDVYWFAGYKDCLSQLKDFFRLTGEVPLIPKYALGNWWSRYRAYTQDEYRALMQKFIDKGLPITVATIDMDWHWTDVVSRFGEDAKCMKPKSKEEALYYFMMQGWTGYSWNTELFHDHVELLSWLHENCFRVPLNIHPSQGVRFFEDAYVSMCERLGKDPEKKEIIPFDITDGEFRKAYFELLHHPLENEGVDFWWIDWQQGTRTNIEGLDPLWALNHYHYLDSDRGEQRPMILSRYSGLGSHRYPLGFSGDTHATWKSLDFQPYFTNCAANAGYTWWSHDIGGHAKGVQDDELYVRWLQLGVFSPINRLHSSNSDYMGKEPWKRSYAANAVAEKFLRLRHKLIPYLYSANYRTHTEGEPICMPMYYRYEGEEARAVKNQYIFGGQLLVAPITKPSDRRLNLASVEVWLPEGRWTDIFNGRVYEGGRTVKMYRDIDSIPVLAPEGAIVPMYKNDRSNDLSLEQPLEIHLWRGNGTYELYEDDGETKEYEKGKYAITRFAVEEKDDTFSVRITPPESNNGVLPEKREMRIIFRDIKHDDIVLDVANEQIVIEIRDPVVINNESEIDFKNALLTRIQWKNVKKDILFNRKYPKFAAEALSEYEAMKGK